MTQVRDQITATKYVATTLQKMGISENTVVIDAIVDQLFEDAAEVWEDIPSLEFGLFTAAVRDWHVNPNLLPY